jgi:hypothetical protein
LIFQYNILNCKKYDETLDVELQQQQQQRKVNRDYGVNELQALIDDRVTEVSGGQI